MRNTLKVAFIFIFLSLLIIRPTSSYAYWHGRGYVGVNIGVWPGPYYYRPYPYYDPYYDPYYAPRAYEVVSSGYQPVLVNGTTYYLNNGAYYIYTQYGYQAVSAPAGVSSQAPVTQAADVTASTDSDDTFTINVPNDKGGYSAVIIKKSGKGFVGPQGEFYADFPKVSQLRVMYGK